MKEKEKIVVLNDYKSHAKGEIPVKQAEKVPKRRFRSKGVRIIKLICLAGILGGVFYLLGYLPFFQINEIDVEGNQALTDEKVVLLSGIQSGENFFYVNTWAAEKRLRVNPFVEGVKVRRALPNKLKIIVTERKAIGYIVTSDGYAQVDQEGRLLAIQQTLSNYNLPVISGVQFSELPAIGGFVKNEKLMQALEILRECDETLLSNIAELNVGQEHYILAYTNQKLEVRLGGLDQIEQRLQDLNQILTTVVGQTIAADQILYIDMRYEGSPIIKLRS